MYNWKRFWCNRTGNINLSDGGYLTDPEGKYGQHFNPDLRSFEDLSGISCLVLLGEPGIGKSTTLSFEVEKTAEAAVKGGNLIHPIRDLRSYSSEDRLVRDIFENPTIKDWINSDKKLYLFLDSLDECLLRIDTIAALLLEQFKTLPTDRLYLRIACRTAEWPNMLEEGLKEIWKNAYEVYELVPLTRRDVVEAVKSNGIAPDVFLGEVDKMNAVPLAIRPVTLSLLIRTFIRDRQLPPTKVQLYTEGCGLLCEEVSAARRAAKLLGNLSGKQRMAVAARIAACTIFANRYAVWTEINLGDMPQEDVSFQVLAGKNEQVDGEAIAITEEVIKETLETGLFSSRGPNRLGWAHQTYAEFLAARFLVQNQVTLPQILSLIVHPGDAKGRITPQLHETVAWLSGMNNEVFRYVMKVNPEILLRSDVATANPKEKAAIVESLLKLFDEGVLIDRGGMGQYYFKLHHTALDSQLRPYITDNSKGYMVRRVAIDIAEECKVQSLQDDLLRVALDSAELPLVRADATRAISDIADEGTKQKLKPLINDTLGIDPDDQIKGYALRALWPGPLTVNELFSSLSLPKRSNFIGIYCDFIERRITPHIKPVDIPKALEWVEKEGHKFSDMHFNELPDSIMLFAWENLEQPGVLSAFARAALSRLKHHEVLFVGKSGEKDLVESSDAKRHALLRELIPLCAKEKDDWVFLFTTKTPVLFSKDIPWLIGLLLQEAGQKSEVMLAKLISRVFDRTSAQQIDMIYEAAQKNKVLYEECKWMFMVYDLTSQEARDEKANWLKITRWERKKEDKKPLDPPQEERVRLVLDACEANNSALFDRLVSEMSLKPDSEYYEFDLKPDLRKTRGWETAPPEVKKRIIEAAKQFLLHNDCVPDKWVGNNSIISTAISGYKAVYLLNNEDNEFVQSLSAEIWKKWVPIVLAYPAGHEEDEVLSEYIRMAYSCAPEEVISTLLAELDKGDYYILDRLDQITDKRLIDALLQKVTNMATRIEVYENIMLWLLDKGVEEASRFAQKMVQVPLPEEQSLSERSVSSAFALIEKSKELRWQIISSIAEKDVELFKRIISKIADRDRTSYGLIQSMTADQLAQLYIRIEKDYPHSKDPDHSGEYSVRDNIASFRDKILELLKNTGSNEACDAIEKISSALPHLAWIKWVLIDAQQNMLQKTWTSPKPSEIMKLSQGKHARLVMSGSQLLDVIIESLGRLEMELQGENPLGFALWDQIGSGIFKPKDENYLSDYVKVHLERDLAARGVILNREVKIRRGYGAAKGEITDIHVDVFDGTQKISAIIETKGCWNRDLSNAMQTQLRDRYLKDNECAFGLYLIGWFNCSLWDPSDHRKEQVPKLDLPSAREQFGNQASSLSRDGLLIRSFVLNSALR